jgi:hypothetical protein
MPNTIIVWSVVADLGHGRQVARQLPWGAALTDRTLDGSVATLVRCWRALSPPDTAPRGETLPVLGAPAEPTPADTGALVITLTAATTAGANYNPPTFRCSPPGPEKPPAISRARLQPWGWPQQRLRVPWWCAEGAD